MNQLFLDILYPVCCSNCQSPIRSNILTLCRACFGQLSEAPVDAVRSVIGRNEFHDIDGVSPIAHALWYYDSKSPVRVLQHRLKYGGHRKLAFQLGRFLGQSIIRYQPSAKDIDVIVPIPLHRVRQLERGYNQAAEIAHGISSILNLPVDKGALARRFISKSQVQSDRENREKNLKDAFALVCDTGLAGKHVLLVDDVVTTGATIRSAFKTLSTASVSLLGTAVLFAVPLDPV